MWAISSLWFPFGVDNGLHAWQGSVLVDGGLPYRDAFDGRGPLVMYGYALAQLAFGANTWGVRVLDLALLALGTASVARAARETTSAWMAAAVAFLFVFWYAAQPPGSLAQPDGWVAMLLSAALCPWLSQAPPTRTRIVLSGILIGLGVLAKPFYGAYLILPLASIVWSASSMPRKLGESALLVAAFAAPIVGCLAAFAAAGILPDFYRAYLLYNLKTYAPGASLGPVSRLLAVVEYFTATRPAAALLPLVLAACALLWSSARRLVAFSVAWLLISVGLVALQGRFWSHHWLIAIPPTCLLAGQCAAAAWRASTGAAAPGRRAVVLVTAALLVVTSVTAALHTLRWGLMVTGRSARAEYWDYFTGYADARTTSFRAQEEVAGYLRRRLPPSSSVLVWGYGTSINYLSALPSPSPFPFPLPLVAPSELREGFRSQFMTRLGHTPPCVVVVSGATPGQDPLLPLSSEYPELERYVRAGFRPDTTIEFYALYVRAGNDGCTPPSGPLTAPPSSDASRAR